MRITVSGLDNIPKSGAVLICGNHFSNWDPILIVSVVKRQLRFMAKKELFKKKIFGKFLNKIGAFAIDRYNNNIKSMKMTINLLKNNEALLIFPQGTREQDVKLSNFNFGVSLFALKTQAPVVPFFISGKYGLFRKIRVNFGPQLYFENKGSQKINQEKLKSVTQQIFDAMMSLDL